MGNLYEPAPRHLPVWLRCVDGHEWLEDIPIGCRIPIFNHKIRTLVCPECGIKSRGIMFKRKETHVETTDKR